MTEVAASPSATKGASVSAGSAPRRRPIAAYVAVAVALVTLVLSAMFLANLGREGESASTPLLNAPAPAARGTLGDGSAFDLSRRKGSWVVLNFFTPDCVPCIREHPELIRFVEQQQSLGSEGAEFYTVVQHATQPEVVEFFSSYGGGGWPVIYDDEFEFQAGFGVAQVPETWLIDPNGVVRGRVVGEVTDASELSGQIQRMRQAMEAGS